MNRILLLILMVWCGVSATRYGDTAKTVQPTRIKQMLLLNETSDTTAYDSSGNGYNGSYIRCQLNQRGFFPSDVSVRLRNSDSASINAYNAGYAGAFKKGGTISFLYKNISWDDSTRHLLLAYLANGNYLSIAQFQGPNRIMFRLTNSVYYVYSNNKAIDLFKNGQWNHFAITWQASSGYNFCSFYVNGIMVKKISIDTNVFNSDFVSFVYGKHPSGYYANAYISSSIMWDTALSVSQIRKLASSTISSDDKTIVCFGDSWTEGYYASQDSLTYTERLGRKLGCVAINSGVGHSTLQKTTPEYWISGFNRYKNDIIDYHPTYVAILYGLNDIFNNLSVDTFYTQLKIVVDSIKKYVPSNRIVLGGQYAIKNMYSYTEVRRSLFTNKIIQVCNETGTKYADIYSSFVAADTTKMMYTDSIHPYDSGMSVIATTFYDQLKSSIPSIPVWPTGTSKTKMVVVNSSRVTESDTSFTHTLNLSDSIAVIDSVIDSVQNVTVCLPNGVTQKPKFVNYVRGKKFIISINSSKHTTSDDTFYLCFGKSLNVKNSTYTFSNTKYENYWGCEDYNTTTQFDNFEKNNGTITSVDTAAGKLGHGTLYNSATDNINCGPIYAVNNSTNLTIESNLYFDNFSATRTMWVAYINTSWRIYLQTTTTQMIMQIGSFNGAFNLSGNMSPTNWYHVIMRWDGTASVDSNRLQIYINGAKKTMTYAGTAPANTGGLIGTNFLISSTSNGMIGKEDEVGIISKSASSGWILDRYRSLYEPATFYTIGPMTGIKKKSTGNSKTRVSLDIGP